MAYSTAKTRPFGHHELFTLKHAHAESTLKPRAQPDKIAGLFAPNATAVTPMALRLFNSLSRRVEAFAPIDPSRVTMYLCGPTVYSYVHIGNARGPVV